MGPLLFSCCIHPLVTSIDRLFHEGPLADAASLVLFYLDDGILCGDVDTVAAGLQRIIDQSARLGLKLNSSKCELILPAGHCSSDLHAKFPSALLLDNDGKDWVIRDMGFEFLGAPIGTADFCERYASERAEKCKNSCRR